MIIMNKKIFISLIIFLLVICLASAQTINTIVIDDCQPSVASASCGATVTYSCEISLEGSSGIILDQLVVFGIGGARVTPTLVSGNTTLGVYEYDLVVSEGGAANFDYVYAKSSDTDLPACSGSFSNVGSVCIINFISQDVSNICGCEETISEPLNCPESNFKEITHTVSSGCSYESYKTLERCDHCDPLWTPDYGDCVVEESLLGCKSGNVSVLTLSYTSLNPDCCSRTNDYSYLNHYSGSDCGPPPADGQKYVCASYDWTTYQSDKEQSGLSSLDGLGGIEFGDDYSDYVVDVSGIGNLSDYQPLSGDLDGDEKSEIIVFTDTTIIALENTGTGLSVFGQYTLSGGKTIDGQPGMLLYDKSDSDNTNIFLASATSIIYVNYDADTDTWSEGSVTSELYGSTFDGSGVMCDELVYASDVVQHNYCYAFSQKGTPYGFNAGDLTVGSNHNYSGVQSIPPVIIDGLFVPDRAAKWNECGGFWGGLLGLIGVGTSYCDDVYKIGDTWYIDDTGYSVNSRIAGFYLSGGSLSMFSYEYSGLGNIAGYVPYTLSCAVASNVAEFNGVTALGDQVFITYRTTSDDLYAARIDSTSVNCPWSVTPRQLWLGDPGDIISNPVWSPTCNNGAPGIGVSIYSGD